jgi:hypothetical protein
LLLTLVFCLTSTHVPTKGASQAQHRIIVTKAADKLNGYISGISKKLDPRVAEALAKIDDTGRRLLALRGYLRSEGSLPSKWSWSADQIERYKQSKEYREAIAEVEKVRKKFETLNPGYTLHVNTEVRSLETQIKSWNETKSVQVAAQDLVTAANMEISKPVYKDLPDQPGLIRFELFIKNYRVPSTPTVAVPGLSPHGQLRAFDFQIKQGDKIIAATNTAMIEDVWDGQGWTEKLQTAIKAASTKFIGPLTSPREPWHYTYNP